MEYMYYCCCYHSAVCCFNDVVFSQVSIFFSIYKHLYMYALFCTLEEDPWRYG